MGGALRHALSWGAAATLVVGGLLGVPADPAAAVSTGRPIAISVAADGTSYVGFATGGRLLRLAPDGEVAGSIALDRAEPVTALQVDPAGTIWVDYGGSVSQLDTDGTLLTHFALDPASCPADTAHDPATYGGIDVTADAVYVAGRCAGTVDVYDRDGDRSRSIDLPGTGLPRGIAVARAYQDVPARLYVSVPDAAKVFVYNLAKLGADPVRTIKVEKDKPNYADPVLGAVTAGAKGQLVVADVANNALYFYDATKDYHFYRTLGHPPSAAPDRGYVDRPAAIDQGGESLKAHLWVADTGNGRVQRWTTDGTTEWMTDTTPPGEAGAPANTVAPQISGTPKAGATLTCDIGEWDGTPASYAISWLRDGLPVDGATEATYVVTAADVGSELSCLVVATSASGAASAPAASDTFPIPGPSSPPAIVTRPEITGDPAPGSILHCTPGTWTDTSPDYYVRTWSRNGSVIPGTNAADYLVTDNDRYNELTCRVVAVNENGASKAALSDPVSVAESGGSSSIDAPINSKRPTILGDTTVGSEVYCDPGRWEYAPTFVYEWRRDGDLIGGSQNDTYTLESADRGVQVTCVVTATNTRGSATATSVPIVPAGTVTDPDDPDDPDEPTTSSTKTCRGKPSVTIDGGRRYARDPYVALRIRVPKGASAVEISNERSFRHYDTRQLRASCRYPWTIEKKSSAKPKQVWVRFVDAEGKVSDRIVLDSAAPKLRRVVAHWRTSWWSWVLTIKASDRGTGIARVQVGQSRGNTRFVKWGHPVNDVDSSKLRWLRVIDRAGNKSRWYHLGGF